MKTVCAVVAKTKSMGNSAEESLFLMLDVPEYKERPFEQRNLGEGMVIVNQVIGEYWKPRFLMDFEAKCAYEFMSLNETLQTVTDADIDWESVKGLPEDVLRVAKRHSFHFPGHIYKYSNGVAEVNWQLQPDGRYYMDEDGFGMTSDNEINLYGAIDRKGRVVRKFSLEK